MTYNLSYSFGQPLDVEGPFHTATTSKENTAGYIRQEFITYKKRSGKLIKETISRVYSENGDYVDSTHVVVIEGGSSV